MASYPTTRYILFHNYTSQMFVWEIKNKIRGPKVIKSANEEHIPFEKQNECFI